MMELKEKVKNLPQAPGVYLMKDSLGGIIYVGKSKSLKNRVGSYFQNSKAHSPKVVKLVKNIRDFEYIVTDTEFEAFMLECKLIRELKPPYNKKMKSPLSYTFIRINIKDTYHSISTCNEPFIDDESLYFGPYTSKNTVERAVQGIKEICGLMCSGTPRSNTPCLNYALGLCIGICIDNNSENKYQNIIKSIINLLGNADKSILKKIEQKMNSAAEKFDFETAARYRDYMSAVSYLIANARVVEFTEENKYIALSEFLGDDSIKFFLIKGNKVIFSSKYDLKDLDIDQLRSVVLTHLKEEDQSSPIQVGRNEIDESQIIYSYLKNSSCKYVVIKDEWQNTENKSLKKSLAALINSIKNIKAEI